MEWRPHRDSLMVLGGRPQRQLHDFGQTEYKTLKFQKRNVSAVQIQKYGTISVTFFHSDEEGIPTTHFLPAGEQGEKFLLFSSDRSESLLNGFT